MHTVRYNNFHFYYYTKDSLAFLLASISNSCLRCINHLLDLPIDQILWHATRLERLAKNESRMMNAFKILII